MKKRQEVLEALTKDGNLHVPGSRYGSDSMECAKVAYRMTKNMEYHGVYDHPVGIADYEANMSLVVNDHDDVAYILKDYKIPRDLKRYHVPAQPLSEEAKKENRRLDHNIGMKLWTCPIPTCKYPNVNRATCFVKGCTGHADRATKTSQVREREGIIGVNA